MMIALKAPLALALALCSIAAVAQVDVVLEIDHRVGTTPLTTSTVAMNALGDEFQVARLEYYVSDIALIHDGGQVTPAATNVVLADALNGTSEMIGNFNITYLEAIVFGIGVNAALNHLDPAQYPANDPLAPRSPSMHWGWTAGYRFVAMEGSSGAGMSQNYELHGLGDVNYHVQTIPTAGILNGNTLTVKLIGDYEEAVRDINVAAGPLEHGESGMAARLIDNFRSHVFTSVEGNGPLGIGEEADRVHMITYPNPTAGSTRVSLVDFTGKAELILQDAAGRSIERIPVVGGEMIDVALPTSGVYQLSLLQNGRLVSTHSVIRK